MSVSKQDMERMKQLVKMLQTADIAYYKHDNPIMTDRAYDLLFDELADLEKKTGVMISGSPTQHVSGDILEELTPVRHKKPMLSADKTKNVEDLERFAKGQDVLLSWKLDGLTIVLYYENGELKRAVTRGRDGIIGEDVTHTVRTFKNVPMTVPCKETFVVRGEGVVSWKTFEMINAGLEEAYKNPRGLAAGSTRKLDATESQKRGLEFIAFALTSSETKFESKDEQLQFLYHNGFDVVKYYWISKETEANIFRVYIKNMHPDGYEYPVDGLILEYDNLAYGESLGATGHHENRMIALKWEDEVYQTKFLGVELATTRTGMVSITGVFEPIVIDGTTVERAYLHNLDIFDEFQFGIGDVIEVYKANMIIPQIAKNCTRSNTYDFPWICPCCGEPLIEKFTSGGTRQLYCDNPNCVAKLVQKFAHFCEKTRMNIEGISATTLEKFIGHGWLRNFGDLYMLNQHKDAIVNTQGFGEKSFERLQRNVEKSRITTLDKVIAGLGIPMVGRHAGRDLAKFFDGSWERFEEAIQNNFDFTSLPDFGESMHNNIYQWYADTEEEKLWRPLLDKLEIVKETNNMNINVNNPFYGKTVVATGKLNGYTRDGIQQKLFELGAKPASSVTKNTDYLIVGEKAGSKLKKAQELGVKILTEEAFETMLA